MSERSEPGSAREIRRVFLVDDEPLVLSALARVMRQEGYEARSFSGPEEALSALNQAGQKALPDCIISDYYMPHMDGLTFLEEVKSRHADIARVLLTGGHIDERVKKALDEEVIHILIRKPWHIDAIRDVMDHVSAGDTKVFVSRPKVSRAAPAIESRLPAKRPVALSAEDGEGPLVVVVDDDPVFLRLMQTWLRRLNFRARTTSAAREALDLAREATPDVMLLDLILPGFDGFELLGALRDLYPHTPIVAITGARERDMAIQAFRRGATVFLHKPIELETLEATIRRCVQLGSLFTNSTGSRALSSQLELQHAIAAGMTAERLLHLLLQEMIRFTRADAASVLLVDEQGDSMRIAASYGISEQIVEQERVGVGERISGWVLEHNQPHVVIGDPAGDPRLEGTIREKPARVGMCLPMRGRDRVIGVVCVTRYVDDEPFTRDAMDLGLLLAGEVARFLERNAAVEEQMDLERSLMRRDKLVTIGELASGVAHEINNPLGYVSSNVASLHEYIEEILPILGRLAEATGNGGADGVFEAAREVDLRFILSDLPVCLRETMEGVDRVLKIVSDLKDFARDDSEVKETGDINHILDGAVSILWNQIKYKAKLVREYGELPPMPCYPSRLGQVFMNLLYNASQAIDRDGQIKLRTFRSGDVVVVEIEDDGAGMEASVVERIFEPFFTTKARGVGTGLGLSIASKIVSHHGGTLTVKSEPGQGSTFRLELPVPESVLQTGEDIISRRDS